MRDLNNVPPAMKTIIRWYEEFMPEETDRLKSNDTFYEAMRAEYDKCVEAKAVMIEDGTRPDVAHEIAFDKYFNRPPEFREENDED